MFSVSVSFHHSATSKLEQKEFASVLIPTSPNLEWWRMKQAENICNKNISLQKVFNGEQRQLLFRTVTSSGQGLWPPPVLAHRRVPVHSTFSSCSFLWRPFSSTVWGVCSWEFFLLCCTPWPPLKWALGRVFFLQPRQSLGCFTYQTTVGFEGRAGTFLNSKVHSTT